MVNPESAQPRSNSLLNISIITICLCSIGYGVYYYESTSIFEDELQMVDVPAQDVTLLDVQQNDLLTTNDVTSSPTTQEQKIVAIDEQTNTALIQPQVLLDESDPVVLVSMAKFSELTLMSAENISANIVRNTVVFVDNFSRGEVITRFSPVRELTSPFKVERIDNELFIDQSSFQRYDTYTNYFTSIDSKAFIQQYEVLKPIIDEAYSEISRPNARFEDTLNEAIELVLNTPIVEGPIKLTSPSVMYLYEDPELENLNDAEKLMLRMGPTNLAKVKVTLRDIQTELQMSLDY